MIYVAICIYAIPKHGLLRLRNWVQSLSETLRRLHESQCAAHPQTSELLPKHGQRLCVPTRFHAPGVIRQHHCRGKADPNRPDRKHSEHSKRGKEQGGKSVTRGAHGEFNKDNHMVFPYLIHVVVHAPSFRKFRRACSQQASVRAARADA